MRVRATSCLKANSTAIPAHKIATMGVAQSPEGRRVFPRMTVLENLEMGAFVPRKGRSAADLDRVLELFPASEGTDQPEGGHHVRW